MKRVNFYTRLIISYLEIDVILIAIIMMGMSFATKTRGIISVASEEIQNEVTGLIQRYEIYYAIAFLISAAIMTAIAIYFGNTIRKTMKMLSEAADELAKGNTNVVLEKKTEDEFGVLIDKFKVVTENRKKDAMLLEEVSNGNLTIRPVPRSEEDLLGNSLKKMVAKSRNALSHISEAANQVLISASEVSGASDALARGSTEQASAIEQITASMDDIAEKTKMNAKEATCAASMMEETMSAVKEGNAKMQEMMQAMSDINHSSESISKIIKVIDDIAFQTNILALNAAVEAARAGDAGKGFAVVAEEVRNLAAKSATAASETAELIETSIRTVATGTSIADTTAKSLDKVTGDVQRGAEIVANIAESSTYQASAIEQIDTAITQVSMVVQTNSATSEECAAASEELSAQARRMKELLSVYKLGGRINREAEDEENELIIALDH